MEVAGLSANASQHTLLQSKSSGQGPVSGPCPARRGLLLGTTPYKCAAICGIKSSKVRPLPFSPIACIFHSPLWRYSLAMICAVWAPCTDRLKRAISWLLPALTMRQYAFSTCEKFWPVKLLTVKTRLFTCGGTLLRSTLICSSSPSPAPVRLSPVCTMLPSRLFSWRNQTISASLLLSSNSTQEASRSMASVFVPKPKKPLVLMESQPRPMVMRLRLAPASLSRDIFWPLLKLTDISFLLQFTVLITMLCFASRQERLRGCASTRGSSLCR